MLIDTTNATCIILGIAHLSYACRSYLRRTKTAAPVPIFILVRDALLDDSPGSITRDAHEQKGHA